MNKDLTNSLIGAAGALLVVTLKPEPGAFVSAGTQLAKLGLDIRQRLDKGPLIGRRALQRMHRKVRDDYRAWAQVERVSAFAELELAEAELGRVLPELLVDLRALARAAVEEGGFEVAASRGLLEALAQQSPVFRDGAGRIAREVAKTLIGSVVAAVAAERSVFDTLQPALLLEMSASLGGIDRKIDRLLAAMDASGAGGGLNAKQVEALLAAFSVEGVPEEDVLPLLLRKARELGDLQSRMQAQADHDLSLKTELERLSEKVKLGAFEEADAGLRRLVEQSGTAAARTLQSVVDLVAMRASLASAQMLQVRAADLYERAAGIALAFDQRQAFYLLGLQVEVLMHHAIASSGDASYRRALAVINQMAGLTPSGSTARDLTVARLVSTLGLYAERAGPAQSRELTEAAIGIGGVMLSRIRATREPELWFGIANDVGAAMNLAVRRAPAAERAKLAKAAVSQLRRAVRVARRHELEDLASGLQNLATALRGLAACGPRKRTLLEEAVRHRRENIGLVPEHETRTLSNAYDSLGNDLRALISVKGSQVEWREALLAYRKALQLRRNAYRIDWARTQFNLFSLYMTLHLAPGADRARLYHVAQRHLALALSVATPEGSPGDFINFVEAGVHSGLEHLAHGGSASDEHVQQLADRTVLWAQVAHRHGGVEELVQALVAAMSLQGHFFVSNMSEHVEVVRRFQGLLDDLQPAYQLTPLGLHIALWSCQTRFTIAALIGDFAAATAARAEIADRAGMLRGHAPAELQFELAELISDLDVRLSTMR